MVAREDPTLTVSLTLTLTLTLPPTPTPTPNQVAHEGVPACLLLGHADGSICSVQLPGGVEAGVLAPGLFGGVVAGVPPASGLPDGFGVGGLQHAASVHPGHTFANAPTNVGSKPGGAAASGAAGATCPPLPMDGAASGPARHGAAFGPRATRDAGALLQEMAGPFARQTWSRCAARSPLCAALSSLTVCCPSAARPRHRRFGWLSRRQLHRRIMFAVS